MVKKSQKPRRQAGAADDANARARAQAQAQAEAQATVEAQAKAEAKATRRRKRQAEARATETLRGVIPSVHMIRARNRLEREGDGITPTSELSVLLTAAKEMVVDLSKSQLKQTAQMPDESHAEMLSILRAQEARLQKLEKEGNNQASLSSESADEFEGRGSSVFSERGYY